MRTLAWTMASSMATAARIMYFCSSIKLPAQPLAVQIAPDRPAQSGVLRSSQLLQCAHVRRRIAHEQGAVPAVNKQQVAPVIFPVLVQQPLRLLPVLLQLEVRLEIADQSLRLLALRLHFDLEFP